MEFINRRKSRQIQVGRVAVGGDAPVSVQSMTNTDTRDVPSTLNQIKQLYMAGCEIVRVAVMDSEAATSLAAIVAQSPLPVIADIHFDYRLALQSIAAGVHGLRLNPGNIGQKNQVREIVSAAKEKSIPIRIGVNAGSLDKALVQKYGGITPQAMVESAFRHLRLLEECEYDQIKISLKASEVPLMIQAYRLLAGQVDYPLHLGVTEAGTVMRGAVKSAVGIGILLAEGIGDTIRVSLTGDPIMEVGVGYDILRSLGLRTRGVEMISCPTCGRCQIDLIPIAEEVEKKLAHITTPLRVAVMGCAVNGPGEAKGADLGIAGGKGFALLFRQGQVVARLEQQDIIQALVTEAEALAREREEAGILEGNQSIGPDIARNSFGG